MQKSATANFGKHLKNGKTSPKYNWLMGQIITNKRNGRKKFRVIHIILIGWPRTSPSLFYMRQMEAVYNEWIFSIQQII